MMGLVLWNTAEKKQPRVWVGQRSILHLRFACAEIKCSARTPEAVRRHRISAAGKRLRKLGVNRAVFPADFPYPYGELLNRQGIRPVSTVPLRRAIAADWVRRELRLRKLSPGTARVAVSAAQLTGEVVRTVTELALGIRYVLLDIPYGGEELCRQLRRTYGVSLLLTEEPSQLEDAEVQVLFDPKEDLRTDRALELYDGAETPLPPLLLPPALERELPPEADRGMLLSALREAGVFRPGQLSVGGAGDIRTE